MGVKSHYTASLNTLAGLLFVLASGCAIFQPSGPPSDVPEIITREDLAVIQEGLKQAPNRLAIFDQELAAQPLDINRSAALVDLDRQRVYIYSQGKLVAASRLASGRYNYRTTTGDYKIGQKNKDHASNLYGNFVDTESGEIVQKDVDMREDEPPEGAEYVGSPMRNFMRFHKLDGTYTAVGFHAGYVPGRPASHGCVRLPSRAASALYDLLPKGLPIKVYGVKYGIPARPLPQEEVKQKTAKEKKKPAKFQPEEAV